MNSPATSQVAQRRASAPHTSMFLRMLMRAAVLRRGRAASALLAMVVAAAVATAMLNLYVDVQAKLRSEFRKYGANIVVVAKDGQTLPADALTTGRIRGRQQSCCSLRVCRGPHRRWSFGCRRRHRSRAGPETEWHLVVGKQLAKIFPRRTDRNTRRQRSWSARKALRSQLSGSHHPAQSGRHVADGRSRRQSYLHITR